MTIDKETIIRLNESIKTNIEVYIALNKESLYEEFSKHNLFLKDKILLECIAYAKMKEGANTPQQVFYNCLNEPSDMIHISKDVPDSIIRELRQHITVILEKDKEYFPIETSQKGRYDLLFKGVLHYIKLLNLNLPKKNIVVNSEISNMSKPMSLQNAVDLYFDKMINCAIVFCKCYEADSKNNKMCLEALHKDFTQYYRYQYKLDPHIEQQLKKDTKLIVNNFMNKDDYVKNIDFDESRIHLSNTLDCAEKFINDFINNNQDLKSKDYSSLIQTYRQIFKNSKKRFQNTKKTSPFLTELKKSNMYHRMPYEDKIIYPFLYDLLVVSFNYSIFHILHKEVNTDINKLMKVVNGTKYLYLEKNSDENYHFDEFKRATEEIPYEYKTLDDPTILIIKHYSEFLDCNHKNIENILRQLRFEVAEHHSSVYSVLQDQLNIELNFDDDYFRKLSLFII